MKALLRKLFVRSCEEGELKHTRRLIDTSDGGVGGGGGSSMT
jgi:hypothetical protein